MTNMMSFLRARFKQWHYALFRVQSMRASQMRRILWYRLADQQANALTIVFHLWLGILMHETRLDILMQVGQATQFLEVQMLFERWSQRLYKEMFFHRWSQRLYNEIGCDISSQTRLFCDMANFD